VSDDLDACVKCYLDHFHRREPFEMRYRLRRHDGVYRTVFDWGVPFDDERGAFAGFIGSAVDVRDSVKVKCEPRPALAAPGGRPSAWPASGSCRRCRVLAGASRSTRPATSWLATVPG